MIDFLIVGHGLAGSVLARTLMKRGYRVMVLDIRSRHSASRVAAGLINPLIGPKFNFPLHIENCLTESENFFRSIEKETGCSLYEKFHLHRIFVSANQRKLWLEKSQNFAFRRYAQSVQTEKECEKIGIEAPLGAGIQLAYRLNFNRFLEQSEQILRAATSWLDGSFDQKDWNEAKKIVFCEGYLVQQNPWFGHLPFAPAQGEILLMENCLSHAASNGTWVVPENKDRCLAGSTWKHDDLESGPTVEGKQQILENLPLLNKITPRIIDHRSGIRPSTRDRSPILGRHRKNEKMFLFNGFGSRGATTIPFYAKHMMNFMINETPLPMEADLKRFEKNETLSR